MQTLTEITNSIIVEGGVDSTTSNISADTVRARINDKYRELVVRSKYRMAEVPLGPTVVDQAEYAVSNPDIAEIEAIRVGPTGQRYGRVGQEDLWDFKAGTRFADKVFAPDYTSAGVGQIELYPAPETGGDTIYALAVTAPLLLTGGDYTILPAEFVPYIVHGVLSWLKGLVDEDPNAAQYHAQMFEDGVDKLRKRRNQRFGGGVIQAQVAGFHF